MNTADISTRRRSWSEPVQAVSIVTATAPGAELSCFQTSQPAGDTRNQLAAVYRILEGELMVRSESGREQAGSGTLPTADGGADHTLANAGGGLLSVPAVRATAE